MSTLCAGKHSLKDFYLSQTNSLQQTTLFKSIKHVLRLFTFRTGFNTLVRLTSHSQTRES